jgi:hypothetical protein
VCDYRHATVRPSRTFCSRPSRSAPCNFSFHLIFPACTMRRMFLINQESVIMKHFGTVIMKLSPYSCVLPILVRLSPTSFHFSSGLHSAFTGRQNVGQSLPCFHRVFCASWQHTRRAAAPRVVARTRGHPHALHVVPLLP